MSRLKASGVFLLRIAGAVVASTVFGLVATTAFAPWHFWRAVLFGFFFGFSFIGGTGYRIVIGVIRMNRSPAPASWSGATTGSALYAAVLSGIVLMLGGEPRFVLFAYGVAIGVAYLPIKLACLRVGCCTAGHGHHLPAQADLRLVEVALTMAVLLAGALAAMVDIGLAGLVTIAGHLGIRLFSRHMRDRSPRLWPPMHQPGAEFYPLSLLTVLAGVAAF